MLMYHIYKSLERYHENVQISDARKHEEKAYANTVSFRDSPELVSY